MPAYEGKCAPSPKGLSPEQIAFADSKVAVIQRQIGDRQGAVQRHDASRLPMQLKMKDACRCEYAMALWACRDWLGWRKRGMPDVDGFEVRGSRFMMAAMTVYPEDIKQHPGMPMAWCRLVNREGKKKAELNLVVCNGWFRLDRALMEDEWWTAGVDVDGTPNPGADHWLVPFSSMTPAEELHYVI